MTGSEAERTPDPAIGFPRTLAGLKHDVFLSHNNSDKALVEHLATRLQDKAGLAPFLDKWHLVPGEPWQEALEKALDESATCAVFLGPSGLGSWENEEMRAALDERVRNPRFRLIPVLLPGSDPKDAATLPRFLRRVTWVDFRAGVDDPEAFRRLVAGIRGEAPGRSGSGLFSGGTKVGPLRRAYRRLRPVALLLLPTLIVAAAALILQNWRIPTRIEITLGADRAHFRIGGNDHVLLLNSVGFQSLTVERFERITFSPAKLERADPALYMASEDRFPESAWKRVSVPPLFVITPLVGLMPAVTLQGDGHQQTAGVLDRVRVEPGSDITVEVGGAGRDLTLQLDGKGPQAAASMRGSFEITTNSAAVTGIDAKSGQTGSLSYRAVVSDDRPAIELTGQPSALTLVVTVPSSETEELFPGAPIPVTALDFNRQGEGGDRVSSVVSGGEIRYPEFPSTPKVTFKSPDLMGLDQLKGFRIEEIRIDPAIRALRVRLSGIAGYIMTGSQEYARDHRLTAFDAVREKPVMLGVLGIVGWMLPTGLAGYALFRELRRQRT